MSDRMNEIARAKGESQEAFEKRVQKETLRLLKRQEAQAKAKYAGGVPDEPGDASSANPVKGGEATKSEQEGRKK